MAMWKEINYKGPRNQDLGMPTLCKKRKGWGTQGSCNLKRWATRPTQRGGALRPFLSLLPCWV